MIHSDLEKRSIESFLLLRTIKRLWSDRTVRVEEPLFKSYIFINTTLDSKNEILKTKGAVWFVQGESQPVPILKNVIESLRSEISEPYVSG